MNTKKSRFVILQLSRCLDANVPNYDGFGYFCCNNRSRYQARSESKQIKQRRKSRSKGRKIEVEPIKGYISNLYMNSYYQIDPVSINMMSGITSAEKCIQQEPRACYGTDSLLCNYNPFRHGYYFL